MLTNNELKYICSYIQLNDRNSDILDFYQEYLDNDSSYDSLYECLHRIMSEWKEDLIFNGLTKREMKVFSLLKIEI